MPIYQALHLLLPDEQTQIDELADTCEGCDVIEVRINILLVQAQQRDLEIDVLPIREFRFEPCPQFQQR